MSERKRVVITGMGAMTPLALTLEETWEGLLAGRSGIGPITKLDASPFPSRIAGELKGFEPLTALNGEEALEAARRRDIDIAIVDYKMPGMDGMVAITKLKEINPQI